MKTELLQELAGRIHALARELDGLDGRERLTPSRDGMIDHAIDGLQSAAGYLQDLAYEIEYKS